ncbi:MAG: dihydroorotate dehydrogenase electron transfer subunit [Methanoregulaceae archaeon]|jgi:dihydroorotate dehydrogenase electron transfer subunit|nr:dihydroorotate dehydrogenase electron transfer subunit [Methanoregulaceae archaeon]
MAERPLQTVQITGISRETPTVQTFSFEPGFSFRPGQFVMVTVPGIDEIPMALSRSDAITVQRVGDATGALFQKYPGDILGIRGPFGNGFPLIEGTLAIAGGVGAAPLRPLVMEGVVDCLIIGARTADELLFIPELAWKTRVLVATDDGSSGFHGPVTGLLKEIPVSDYHQVCVCGPEKMMQAALLALDAVGMAGRSYFSLHRYMKCGIGVCGSCCIDPDGRRVCRDGPVFAGNTLIDSELGKYSRDASGRKKPV